MFFCCTNDFTISFPKSEDFDTRILFFLLTVAEKIYSLFIYTFSFLPCNLLLNKKSNEFPDSCIV